MKKLACLCGVLSILFIACSDGGSSGSSHSSSSVLSSISVTIDNNVVRMESTLELPDKGMATYDNGSTKSVTVTYSLKDANNEFITLNGRTITPKAEGSAVVIASYTQKSVTKTFEITITVVAKDAPDVKSITVTSDKTTLAKDEVATFTTTATNEDDTTTNVSTKAQYSATPSNAGTITSNTFKAGTLSADTEVTITASYAGKSNTVKITVTKTASDSDNDDDDGDGGDDDNEGSADISGDFN